MRSFALALLLSSVSTSAGCTDSVGFIVDFEDGAGADASAVTLTLHRDSCTGEAIYNAVLTRASRSGPTPPALTPGRYFVHARASDDTCQLVGEACREVVVPYPDDSVRVTLAPISDGRSACFPGEICDSGACVEVDCGIEPDGTPCATGAGFICRTGQCGTSYCGDGVVDPALGEECDEIDEDPGDGCEPGTCEFTCSATAECDDGSECNGAELCSVDHVCVTTNVPPSGSACTRGDGSSGICRSGSCVDINCGDGFTDPGEECDDAANGDDTDGCRDDCQFTCTEDLDCNDGEPCTGDETCDVDAHLCQAGTPIDCDDAEPCTIDICERTEGICLHAFIDNDGDGFAPGPCTGMSGGDCNDAAANVYPLGPEYCDTLDNDCDGLTDENTMSLPCYRDEDGDGFGVNGVPISECACPPGYVSPHPLGFDCNDAMVGGASVYPGQTTYFQTSYCPSGNPCSYDYDCDGVETRRWTRIGGMCNLNVGGGGGCDGTGWLGGSAPACGESGTWRTCRFMTVGMLSGCMVESDVARVQQCR